MTKLSQLFARVERVISSNYESFESSMSKSEFNKGVKNYMSDFEDAEIKLYYKMSDEQILADFHEYVAFSK